MAALKLLIADYLDRARKLFGKNIRGTVRVYMIGLAVRLWLDDDEVVYKVAGQVVYGHMDAETMRFVETSAKELAS